MIAFSLSRSEVASLAEAVEQAMTRAGSAPAWVALHEKILGAATGPESAVSLFEATLAPFVREAQQAGLTTLTTDLTICLSLEGDALAREMATLRRLYRAARDIADAVEDKATQDDFGLALKIVDTAIKAAGTRKATS